MNRKQRTEILIRGQKKISEILAKQVLKKYDVKTIEEPNYGMVMVKMRETAKKSLFYLGEVFVTECKVQVNGELGTGIVKGDNPELSYHLAIIDAAYRAAIPETLNWESTLEKESTRIKYEKNEKNKKILQTKVNFETMDV